MPAELRDQLQASLGHAYTILFEVGGGGMSRVFAAEEVAFGRRVAVKVLAPELAAGVNVERFRREIQLAARLQHPCIVPLLAAGVTDPVAGRLEESQLPYYTMPFVEGESLRRRLARDGALPAAQTVKILRDVASAMAYAHERGVVHRDIKPENVLLSGGYAMVLDFGVAKAITVAHGPTGTAVGAALMHAGPTNALTTIGTTLGTPAYMAPEQVVAESECDHRVDLYAWGVMAYEMLAGAHPFAGRAAQAMMVAHVVEAPEPLGERRPGLPHGLVDLVTCCLAKPPEDRPGSAAALVEALDALGSMSGATDTAAAATTAASLTLAATRSPPVTRSLRGAKGTKGMKGGVTTPGRTRSPAKREPVTKPIDSLAVLPFVNAGGDAEGEYFSDGITEGIINKLSALSELRVVSRSTAFRYKDRDVDPERVGRELKVRAVVTGRTMQRANALVVKAELLDVARRSQLWGEQYNRPMSDVFAVQEEIIAEISRSLQLKLSDQEQRGLAKRSTENPDAYRAYLKGRFYWNKRTPDGFLRANQYFQEAIAIDPRYALAWAGTADTYHIVGYYNARPPHEVYPKGKAAAARAIELDPALAEPHASLGFAHIFYDRDWPGADAAFRRALALDPGYATAHQWQAWYYLAVGRFDDALAAMRRAQELDPLSLVINDHLGYALWVAGRRDEAVEQLRRTQELDPSFPLTYWRLGSIHFADGDLEAAAAAFRRAAEMTDWRLGGGYLGQALAAAGRPDEARAVLAHLRELCESRYVSPLEFALVRAGLGEYDAAFASLGRAVDDRVSDLARFTLLPWPDAMRADPRFAEVGRRLGF